jgi:hypothetical protein
MSFVATNIAKPIPWIGRIIQLFVGRQVGFRSVCTCTRFRSPRLKKPCNNEQPAGRRRSGSVNTRESRKKRTMFSHIALTPEVKVNSVMRVEMNMVAKRIAAAGPISLISLITILLNFDMNTFERGHFLFPPFSQSENTPGYPSHFPCAVRNISNFTSSRI